MKNYKRETVNVPVVLQKAVEERIKEAGYWSTSAYLMGLIIFDLWCRREHKLTAPIFRLPPKYRDPIFEECAAKYLAGECAERGERKSWLDEMVERQVAKKVADELAKAERSKRKD